jgi:Tol biopolymer transport system component
VKASIRGVSVVAVTVLATSALAESPASAAYPGHAGLIAFSSVVNGTAQIFTINPVTGARKRLTANGGQNPCWSPYGTQIAFDRNGDLWVMNANGTHQHDITKTANVVEEDPTWSPDGRRLAYMRSAAGPWRIAVLNADGSNRKVLTTDSGTDSEPAWSTTNKIAFVSDRTGRRQIWVMNADGSNQHNVSKDASDDVDPAWSPDGTQIAYSGPMHPKDSVGGDLWTMSANGSSKTAVVHQPTGYSDGSYPAWSPDGRTLEFSANNGLGALRLWAYSFGSGQQTQLTNEKSQPYDRSGDWQPVHAPAQFSLSRSSGAPGVTVTVTGEHFAKRERVALTLVRGTRHRSLVTVKAGMRGRFSTTVTIPRRITAGSWRIVGRGMVSALVARAPFTVT